MPRALLLVLDSVGCGGAEDAANFSDAGADTLGHIATACAKGGPTTRICATALCACPISTRWVLVLPPTPRLAVYRLVLRAKNRPAPCRVLVSSARLERIRPPAIGKSPERRCPRPGGIFQKPSLAFQRSSPMR
jgi:hypothetical protein